MCFSLDCLYYSLGYVYLYLQLSDLLVYFHPILIFRRHIDLYLFIFFSSFSWISLSIFSACFPLSDFVFSFLRDLPFFFYHLSLFIPLFLYVSVAFLPQCFFLFSPSLGSWISDVPFLVTTLDIHFLSFICTFVFAFLFASSFFCPYPRLLYLLCGIFIQF